MKSPRKALVRVILVPDGGNGLGRPFKNVRGVSVTISVEALDLLTRASKKSRIPVSNLVNEALAPSVHIWRIMAGEEPGQEPDDMVKEEEEPGSGI